jgi:hypothetical protein
MLPPSFSFHEAYGKHRNPDEIRDMERQNQMLEARSYQYGDPVNTNQTFPPQEPEVKETVPARKRRLAVLVLRFIHLFLS